MTRWKRHSDGDGSTAWTATIGGKHYIVVNMQGQSVRYTGVGSHVLVLVAERPDDPWGKSEEIASEYSVGRAKAWAERNASRPSE